MNKKPTGRKGTGMLLLIAAVLLLPVSCMSSAGLSLASLAGEELISLQPAVPGTSGNTVPVPEPEAASGTLPSPEETAPEKPVVPPGREAILAAIDANDLETLERLLAGVEDIRPLVNPEDLLLHRAEKAMIAGGMENPVTRLLVEKHAYILQLDEKGNSFRRVIQNMELAATPRDEYAAGVLGDKFVRLQAALREDSLEDFQPFLEYLPADQSLLARAVDSKAGKITRFLLDRGLDPLWRDPKTGDSLLHRACDNRPSDYPFEERGDLIRLLLQNGADPAGTNEKGETPLAALFEAARYDGNRRMGSPAVSAALLLEAGGNAGDTNSRGEPLLYTASGLGDPDSVRLLLDHGARPDKAGVSNINQTEEIFLLFLERGAAPGDLAGTVWPISDSQKQQERIQLLLDRGASAGDFDLSSLAAHFDTVAYLVDRGAPVAGTPILMKYVLEFKGMEPVIYLAEHGADLNQRYGPREITVLHAAVRNGQEELTKYLLDRGANPNLRDTQGKTALDYCSDRRTALKELLSGRGALYGEAL